MLEVLCASKHPLSVAGLGLVLEERKKRDFLELYVGDLVWGILGSLHAIGGGSFQMPSCTEVHDLFQKTGLPKREKSIRHSLDATIKKYTVSRP